MGRNRGKLDEQKVLGGFSEKSAFLKLKRRSKSIRVGTEVKDVLKLKIIRPLGWLRQEFFS
jgi:hypothetical protein